MTSTATFADLIRHEEFVRKTLRGLLRDGARVEEGIQETWLQVLRRPHEVPREPQTWLARIARNTAISLWRSEQRRQRREQHAVREAEQETPETSVARMEMRQRVVAATLALDEPYRTVVVLRYEQDLDAAAIAARLGRSPATVRSQLSRAHDLLREKLDRDFGGREKWALLAMPLARPSSPLLTARVAARTAVLIGSLGAAAAVGSQLSWGGDPRPPAVAPIVVVADRAGSADAVNLPTTSTALTQRTPGEIANPQEPRPAGLQERLLPRAQLRDRAFYDDYEAATFSFEHGLRDDPGLSITRNDWDVQFSDGRFCVDMVVDDDGLVADLGAVTPAGFGAWRGGELAFAKETTVVAGHAYYLGTSDSDTELATVVFVTELVENDTCTFEWYTTDGTNRAQGSLLDPGTGRPWVRQLETMHEQQVKQRTPALAKPEVRLQLRGGAGGGNPRRIRMDGRGRRVDAIRVDPLDLQTPITVNDPCSAYVAGGAVPDGNEFVITRIDYSGGNPGDSNGHGAFRIVVANQLLVEIAPSEVPIAGTWTGRVVVPAGKERETWFEIANSSWGDVWLRGEFVASAAAARAGFHGENRGFLSDAARPVAQQPWLLGVPSARLQVRAGSVGGNPCRIDLRGRKSIYVRSLAHDPLDFTSAIDAGGSVAFARGGVLPPGTVFVVTKVRYSGSASGDGNGHGALRVVIAGTPIVDAKDTSEPIEGEWTGSLEIPPGQESRTYLEVANNSHGDAELFGYFDRR